MLVRKRGRVMNQETETGAKYVNNLAQVSRNSAIRRGIFGSNAMIGIRFCGVDKIKYGEIGDQRDTVIDKNSDRT